MRNVQQGGQGRKELAGHRSGGSNGARRAIRPRAAGTVTARQLKAFIAILVDSSATTSRRRGRQRLDAADAIAESSTSCCATHARCRRPTLRRRRSASHASTTPALTTTPTACDSQPTTIAMMQTEWTRLSLTTSPHDALVARRACLLQPARLRCDRDDCDRQHVAATTLAWGRRYLAAALSPAAFGDAPWLGEQLDTLRTQRGAKLNVHRPARQRQVDRRHAVLRAAGGGRRPRAVHLDRLRHQAPGADAPGERQGRAGGQPAAGARLSARRGPRAVVAGRRRSSCANGVGDRSLRHRPADSRPAAPRSIGRR